MVGDLKIFGKWEHLLNTDRYDVKLQQFRDVTIEDREDKIKPILERQPDFIIIHVGTNNANNMTSREILNKMLQLKLFIFIT